MDQQESLCDKKPLLKDEVEEEEEDVRKKLLNPASFTGALHNYSKQCPQPGLFTVSVSSVSDIYMHVASKKLVCIFKLTKYLN